MVPYKILIVDDSQNLRKIVKNFLSTIREFPVEIYEASNGQEALYLVQEAEVFNQSIDLVLLDWMMPEVSGFEFLQRLRTSDPFRSHPAVIMLTAETNREQIEACQKLKVDAYLLKPFTAAELCEAVLKIFSERNLAHAV